MGGHGIPAAVGIVAFERLRERGVLAGTPTEEELLTLLEEPLTVHGRTVRYRFAKQKARYVSEALKRVATGDAPLRTGRALRDWLLQLNGIGPEHGLNWIARNWLRADDVAILDIHILRVGVAIGLFPEESDCRTPLLRSGRVVPRFQPAHGRASLRARCSGIRFDTARSPLSTQVMLGNKLPSTSVLVNQGACDQATPFQPRTSVPAHLNSRSSMGCPVIPSGTKREGQRFGADAEVAQQHSGVSPDQAAWGPALCCGFVRFCH